jgi:hypothetical protein
MEAVRFYLERAAFFFGFFAKPYEDVARPRSLTIGRYLRCAYRAAGLGDVRLTCAK